MKTKLIAYDDLKSLGIPGAKPTIYRKERAGRFPKRVPLGSKFYAWPENVIDAYVEALAAGCDEIEACLIAERERKQQVA
jgi:prophage regulatory protein